IYGNFGSGTTDVLEKMPRLVGGLPPNAADLTVTPYQVNNAHACVVAAGTRTVYCWGSNAAGELGHDPSADDDCPSIAGCTTCPSLGACSACTLVKCQSNPMPVKDMSMMNFDHVLEVRAGYETTCALRDD